MSLFGLISGNHKGDTKRRLYHDTVQQLSDLADHDLSDIGIRRGDISAASRKAVYGK